MNYTEKNKLIDNLCGAILMALLVEIFYGITDSAYTVFNYNISDVTKTIYIFGGIFLAISIIVLIMAYRKEKATLAAYGIELMALAITAAILPNTYTEFPFPFNKLNIIFPLVFGIYYIMKTMILITKRSKSSSIILGLIELLYIAVAIFSLYALKEIMFIALAVISLIALIYAMIKKSKFILVHGLEITVCTLSVLLIDGSAATIFFAIMFALYYLVKSVVMAGNTKNSSSKKRRRK